MSAPATTITKLMTADEFWDYVHRPENEERELDLIRGEVVEMPRARRPHGIICNQISFALTSWVATGQPGYIAINDAGVVLHEDPDTVVGPDVAYYTDANTFENVHPKWGEVAPVLAVEVLSPTDRPGRVSAKVQEYLTAGTKLVWLVDYEEHTFTVYRPDQRFVVLKATDTLEGFSELPGFRCRVSDLFRLPGQPAPPPTPPIA